MPSWMTHLVTATKIYNKLEKKIDKDEFLIGNLITDAEKWIIQDFSIYVPWNISHYGDFFTNGNQKENIANPNKFLEHHKNQLENPIVLGYLTHLLTDYYWNKVAYFEHSVRDENNEFVGVILKDGNLYKCKREERTKMKHADFAKFANFLARNYNYDLPNIKDSTIEDMKDIFEIPFNQDDIKKIIFYLQNNKIMEENEEDYKMFTQDELIKDYNESIEYIIEYFKLNKIYI